ncbi:hypothetical protein LFL96_00985 [Paraburkholderia sp. D15]|uniref:hypothetical protein n=1 Tax=Paraburkholderia sp. D15 TaxID=2880218 RepID=UPI00247B2D18|nr:hypothetical protein [Paraburkholderia sp. D15]WGS50116.1 hypothetical protein LFL96_00985 [Paraburkholderia sp. D15]
MNLPLPEVFHPALRSDCLGVIADILIDEHFTTLTDLQSEYDDGYSRGTTRFARQKNRLKSVALSGQYEWLQLRHAGNDLIFTIDGIPCRFATDDPANPTKPAVLEATPIQQSFFDEVESGVPCKFCFILDGGYAESDDPRVVFVGEDLYGAVKCRWTSDGMKTLHAVSANTPPAKDVGKAPVGPKRIESDKTSTPEAP